MPATKVIHYHKYERQTWPNGKPFYKCMEPNCPHYLPVAILVIGKESLCWGYLCNNLVQITKEDVAKGIKNPMCGSCKDKRKELKDELSRI
jgi:hypothetical protein